MRQQLILGSTLPTVLFMAIFMLLLTHLYFTFSSQCSVESQILYAYNPFFEESPERTFGPQ